MKVESRSQAQPGAAAGLDNACVPGAGYAQADWPLQQEFNRRDGEPSFFACLLGFVSPKTILDRGQRFLDLGLSR